MAPRSSASFVTMAEMATLMLHKLPVKVVIIDNKYLGMVRQWQQLFYGRRYAATPISSPDFVKLAEAHGIAARRVTQRDEVIPAVQAARAHPGPMLIDLHVQQEDCVYPMVPAGADLREMIRRPLEMEMAK